MGQFEVNVGTPCILELMKWFGLKTTFGNVVIMSGPSEALEGALAERGYVVVETPLDAFLRSGGSACCLTLRLDHDLQLLS